MQIRGLGKVQSTQISYCNLLNRYDDELSGYSTSMDLNTGLSDVFLKCCVDFQAVASDDE